MLYLYYLLLLITTYHPTIGQGGRVVQSYVNRHLALSGFLGLFRSYLRVQSYVNSHLALLKYITIYCVNRQ